MDGEQGAPALQSIDSAAPAPAPAAAAASEDSHASAPLIGSPRALDSDAAKASPLATTTTTTQEQQEEEDDEAQKRPDPLAREAEPAPQPRADPCPPAAPPPPPLSSIIALDTTSSASDPSRPATSPLPPLAPSLPAATSASAAPTPTPTSTSTATSTATATATATPAPTHPAAPPPAPPTPTPPEDPFSLPFSDPYRAVRDASQWNSLLTWARKVRLECAPGGAERGWDFGTGMYHVPKTSAEYTAGVKRLSDEAISSSKTPLPTLSLHAAATRGGGSSILYSQNPDSVGNMGSDDENGAEGAGGGGGGEKLLLTESGRPKRSRAAMTRG